MLIAFALALLAWPVAAGAQAKPQTFRDCRGCPEMVVVPAGAFTMGSPAGEALRYPDEGPQRQVTFAREFAVSRLEITRGQYDAFSKATGRPAGVNCYTDRGRQGVWTPDPKGTWRDPGYAQTDEHPAVCLTWDDAKAYVAWLNTRTGGGYRLLSEAEWEYAARAGTTSPFPWGADPNSGCAHMNGADAGAKSTYGDWTTSTCADGALHTSVAGSYRPNAFGLNDMIGNVWEWVEDCYEQSFDMAPTDGRANTFEGCPARVLRGGSWYAVPQDLRSAVRNYTYPSLVSMVVGFRVAKTL